MIILLLKNLDVWQNANLKDVQKNQSSNPSNSEKKKKSAKKWKDPSVDELKNILKKPDKGENNKE